MTLKKERLPIVLRLPEDIRTQQLNPHSYTWINKLHNVLGEICPGYSLGWIDTGKWTPDYVYVDEETALYLILKHQFVEVTNEQ